MPVFQKFTELIRWLVTWATDTFPPMYQQVVDAIAVIAGHAGDANDSADAAAQSALDAAAQVELAQQEVQNAAEEAVRSAESAEEARTYASAAEDVISRQATPTELGAVYSSSETDIANGEVNHMVDAAQMKKAFEDKIQMATSTVAGINTAATAANIVNGTGDGFIRASQVWAILAQTDGGTADHSIEYNKASGFPYTLIELGNSQERVIRLFGNFTITAAATQRIILPAALTADKFAALSGSVDETVAAGVSVRKSSGSTDEYIEFGLWDGSAWVPGSGSLLLEAQLGSGLLPARPVNVQITSPQSDTMIIAWE